MSNIFLIVVFLASLLYISMKYKADMKKASAGKVAAAVLASIVLIAGAVYVIYLGDSWISNVIGNPYVLVVVQFIYVLLTLSVCSFLINFLFKKATNESDKKTA